MASKADCIAGMIQAGATEMEAREIYDMLEAQKQKMKEAGVNAPDALLDYWNETTKAMLHQQAVVKKRTALAALAFSRAQDFIARTKEQGFGAMDAIQALLVGVSKRFDGARSSVTALRQGISKAWLAPMVRELEAVADGVAVRMMREDKAFHDDVFREMREPNSTSNKEARQIADIFSRYMEQSRQQLNAAGADIGKLDGWTPQNHDPEKLMQGATARQDWVNYIYDRLDHDRTFEKAGPVDEAKAKEILSSVYDTLTIGKDSHVNLDITGGGATPPATPRNLAASLGHSRVLHFKSADAALEYHDKYGRGNIFDAMVRRLESDARNLALMQQLGPNPQSTIQRLLDAEKTEVHQSQTLTQQEKKKRLQELDNAMTSGLVRQGKVNTWLAELTGETSWRCGNTLAKVGSFLRATQTLSKLGAASLSAVADVFTKAASMRCNGETWPGALSRSLGDYFRDYGQGRHEAARQCGAFLDYVSQEINARWDDASGVSGVMADLQDKMFRWSGLNWITERGKAGYTLWLSNRVGEAGGKDFAKLDKSLQSMLAYHGIDADRWEIMGKLVQKAEDQKPYFCPELATHLSESDLAKMLPDNYSTLDDTIKQRELDKARHKVQQESMAMLVDETGFAIIEPDDATRAIMRQGTRPGTPAGEFWRAAMQFKSFPIAYMQRVLGGRRWVKGERQSGMTYGFGNAWGATKDAIGRDMGGLTGFVLSSVAFGYAAMCLKDLSKGREIRGLDKKETWLAAMVQAGGAGIFGDFLFGKVNRFGNDFAATAVGPVGGLIGDLVKVAGQVVRGDFQPAGEDALRLAMGNLPMVNLWWTRAALDWTLLYHVREMLSPGCLSRMERAMKKDFNQEFIVSPSAHIARGGGWR